MFRSTSGGGGGGGGRDNNESLAGLTQMMMMNVPPRQPAMVVGGGADAEDFLRRDDRVPSWSQQETRDFIAIRGELERDFTTAKRNKSLWEVVAAKMKEIGYRRTPDQCKCKWKNLVNRYKGKETLDRENSRSFPFFDEMHALFTERTSNTPPTPFDPEATSSHSKKRGIKMDSYQSLEELSEDEDEYEDEEIKIAKATVPPRKKPEREKRARTSSLDKPPTPKQPSSGNNSIREILHDFFQQQEMIETQWRQLMEKHDYERRVFDQEWRQSMERLEMERMRIEQSWREKEEQRRMREESRAERRDALLTALLNKLVHEQ
ncbi:trihelix transcription factor GT-3b-like [Cynara cardunculus var. scolymus]|uniref:Myb-like domain-containing protein n=1 Tax=Cynara cardunculus var. scolymus TaxID=59895 RepID=A0A103XJ07_CYNCS|nr:trihelix transcription factor GT-3b-like [Cynara cardunculus var. scolymus]XP_024996778.1 trihelix transcription factor GT-3b-like [Cynara cardunculus var. scolymus]KVH91538.1 Myb-like domain-containing protein [Cynara cardunculus var. scolymus]